MKVIALALCLLCAQGQERQVINTSAQRYLRTATTLSPARGVPRSTTANGKWQQAPINDWTSGFFAGTLWNLYLLTHNEALKTQAERWTLPLAAIPEGTFSHDLGFQFNSSFANAYRITQEERFRIPVMNAARLLANRFNPTVGAIKSWDWMPADKPFPVIADNMMNLELLFWAARQKNGDPHWKDIAIQHARTTLANHVRADGSSYHVVVYDPKTGKVLQRITHQGYADSTTWARGEAWLVYGFTMVFRETGDRTFLDAARKVADYYIAHLPADGVPCWDFQAPDCLQLRDASAAAVAASGLLELSHYVERPLNEKYRNSAEQTMRTLESPAYFAKSSDALLKHAVGNKPANTEVDVGITYADYYFTEALLREQGVLPARLPQTFVYRGDQLRKSKERIERKDKEAIPALDKLVAEADSAMNAGPWTVTAKQMTPPSGDKHDYVSYGPYWWPDSTKPNGLPYIQRDGQVNPVTRKDSDVLRWYALDSAVETLSHAYYFTDNAKYAERAATLLRTWFLDPATRMNPNQNYGQAIPGVVEGRGIGLIDFRDMPRMLDAVSLISTSPSWSEKDASGLRDWFAQYVTWLKTSKNGRDEAEAKNNHGTWYSSQLGGLELHLGDTASARALFEEAKTKRIASEIEPDGKQPLELARTRSLHYSVENLDGMTRMAEEARNVGVDLWHYRAPNGGSIKAAIDYVAPYADTTKIWPDKQITKEPDDLFVPLLFRARIALGDAKYLQLAEKLPPHVIEGHRAFLLYPQPHPSAPCDVDCITASQVVVAGRRTAWIENGRYLDAWAGAKTLLELMQIAKPSNAVQLAVNGGVAWLKDVALYKGTNGPAWTRLYEVGTNAPVDTAQLSTEPRRAIEAYEQWRSGGQAARRSGGRGKYDAVVGSARFPTIGSALRDSTVHTIFIKKGRYNERLSVERPNVSFTGESRDSTILSFDVAAGYASPTGGTYGTRGAWVLRIASPGFRLSNMTVENTFDYMANYQKTANDSTKLRDSQGLAVMLDAGSDRAVFEKCKIIGHQDTFFPNAGRTYVHGCTISGSVDFIFGAGRVVFDSVDVVSRDRGSKTNNGYITAPSTPVSQPYGFVFLNSRLLKENSQMASGTVALGRPWHPSSDPNAVGSSVFINTWMDDHISAKGWESMNSIDATGTRTTNRAEDARFFEYGSKGPGAVRSETRRVLSDADAKKYTISRVLEGWTPRRAD